VSDTLGWVFYKKDLPQLAVQHLSQAVELSGGSNPVMHFHLAMAYMKLGDAVKAKASLERALKLSTSFPGADEARKTLSTLG
jgi:Flp pilus assembly protein TadD